jgi:nickel superoxide dismutase|tara:strand:- start:64 stop:540 length:477 start_codon:yes stop_codon:yes gene_type:complete
VFNPFGLIKAEIAEAHCDIPCGIYDPIAAKIAAQTVQKMVQRIQALAAPDPGADAGAVQGYANTVSRYVTVKEEHAEICKHELRVLWADYFRPEHVEAHPDLHTTFWDAEKLAGRNKQNVDPEAAQELVAAVDRISVVFWATKNVVYSDPNAAVRYGS